jgi:acetyltransferase
VPVYSFPENAARAMGTLYEATRWLKRRILPQYELQFDSGKARSIVEECLASGKTILGEYDGAPLLECYGFRPCAMKLAETAGEAARIADELGYPVVLKVFSQQILHKSDAGGVKVGLKTAGEVRDGFTEILENAWTYAPDAEVDGVLVQKMAPSGEEVILGVNRYPGFGHLLMFGFGGIYVELFKNVVFRLAPVGRNTARRMIRSIKGYELLTGFRGRPRADIEEIERLLVGLSQLVVDNPEIKELDINPLFVHQEGQGATVADIIITLEPEE